MAQAKRCKTRYPGVFFRETQRVGMKGTEKVFYIVFKKEGKVIEEKVGRQFVDNMTEAKAAGIRAERIEGKRASRKEIREVQEAIRQAELQKPTIERLWEVYGTEHSEKRSLRADMSNFKNHLKAFAQKAPDELCTADLTRLKKALFAKGLQPATVHHVLALLRLLIRFGVRNGLCAIPDPQKLHFEMPRVDNLKTEMLTPEQLMVLKKVLEESDALKIQIAKQDALRGVLQCKRQKAIKDAADTGDMEIVEELSLQLNRLGMKKRLQLPRLFVNDVTSASLADIVSHWGYTNIMDPDGTSLDFNTYRQIAKYWSGEGNAQLRVTRDSSVIRQPFINCVVFTQPYFFRELVLAEAQKAMGITARSLLYACPPSKPRGSGKRDVNEGLMRSFQNKLHMLLESSTYASDGSRPSQKVLQVEPEGVEALRDFHQRMGYQIDRNKRVRDWCIRAAQQAYRVAGIFHLCEHDDPWASSVSTTEVEMAINFMWTAYDYVVAAVCPNHDQDTLKCILKIAEWCEEHSGQRRVSNKESKDAMRGAFRAQKVDIAISWLIDWRLLTVCPSPARYGSGRPLGDWYQNNAEMMH